LPGVGRGNGSAAVWLADQVGPDGHVTATDLDVRHIPEHDRVSVVSHDLTRDPVPDGPFDLIHVRLLLGHLPNRPALLSELTARLAPGGTILIEDFNTTGAGRATAVLHAPSQPPGIAELWTEYEALRRELFTASGTDGSFIIQVHGLLVDAGLTDVQTVTYCQSWRGGDPGSRHAAAGPPEARRARLRGRRGRHPRGRAGRPRFPHRRQTSLLHQRLSGVVIYLPPLPRLTVALGPAGLAGRCQPQRRTSQRPPARPIAYNASAASHACYGPANVFSATWLS
jgi:SAM-dependent methyltransferase